LKAKPIRNLDLQQLHQQVIEVLQPKILLFFSQKKKKKIRIKLINKERNKSINQIKSK